MKKINNNLTEEELIVLRDKGTERAFSGKFDSFYEDGTYRWISMEGNNIGLTFTDTEIAGYGYNCWIRFNEENSTSEQVRIPWNEVTGVRIISFPKRNSGALTIPDFFEINNTLFILHQKK